MFSNGRQYNNGNDVNTNTRLWSTFSDTAMVVMNAWNQNYSMKFHPFKGLDANGIRQYAQDKMDIINVVLTPDNAHALLEGIDNVLAPAIEEGKEECVGILTGSGENRKTFSVRTDGTDIFLVVAVGVNENGIPIGPESILEHKLNKRAYSTSFNPLNGEGVEVEANAEYIRFVTTLRMIDELTPIVPHAINYNTQIRSVYASRPMNQQSFGSGNYSAPVQTFGSDVGMESVLPSL